MSGKITNRELADNCVDSSKIADGAVGNTELSVGSISNDKLENGSVYGAKLAPATTNVLGGVMAGSGVNIDGTGVISATASSVGAVATTQLSTSATPNSVPQRDASGNLDVSSVGGLTPDQLTRALDFWMTI